MAMQPKRDYGTLNSDILHGRAGKKVIFQPRIDCWYSDRIFRDKKLPAPYDKLDRHDLYCELDVSPRAYEYNCCIQSFDRVPVKRYRVDISPLEWEEHIETPVGNISYIIRSNDSNGGSYYKTFPAKNEDDLRILTWLEDNTYWGWNAENYKRMQEYWGVLGLPAMFIPRVNIQKAMIETLGVEGTIYGLNDFPDVMEEYFRAVDDSVMRLINDVLCSSPLEWINFGDNIHGGVTSPELFEKYILPAYLRRNEALHKAGKFTYAHWDGDCKPILKFAKVCGLDGIEAITPVPQGDVTIDEIKEALGDDIFLIDGIPAILFEDIFPEKLLLDTVKELIDKFAPKLILGISDEMSSMGNIERIKLVRDYVDSYNASLDK